MRKDDRKKKEVKTRNTHNALGYTRKKKKACSHSFKITSDMSAVHLLESRE